MTGDYHQMDKLDKFYFFTKWHNSFYTFNIYLYYYTYIIYLYIYDIKAYPLLDGGVFVLHLPLLHCRIDHQLIQLRGTKGDMSDVCWTTDSDAAEPEWLAAAGPESFFHSRQSVAG